MEYGTAEFKVPAVVKPQIDTNAATPSPTTVAEDILTLDITQGQSEMPIVTSRPGSSPMMPGSEKPLEHKFRLVVSPDVATNSMPIQDLKPVEPESF
jgi:hypothetical protein